MKLLSTLIIFVLIASNSFSQKYITKTGQIKFFSDGVAEDIEAINNSVSAAIDSKTGDFQFKLLMKSFEFKKALMQEHFNENYVESDKFPNSTFVGKVLNMSDINFEKDGKYEAKVEGELSIHGVTKKISEKGTFTVNNGSVKALSVFNVKLSDFDIKIPQAVVNNLAEIIQVTVTVDLKKL